MQWFIHNAHENVTSSDEYHKIMIEGSGYETICEITVACQYTLTDQHPYLLEGMQTNIKCFTKQILDINKHKWAV